MVQHAEYLNLIRFDPVKDVVCPFGKTPYIKYVGVFETTAYIWVLA